MSTEHTENATKDATVGAPGTAVAPEKAPAKKTASPQQSAPQGQRKAQAPKPKAAASAQPKKAAPAKVAAKAPKAAQPKDEGVRAGSKTATILDLLHRAKGATLADIQEATSWQAHYADVRIMPTCVGNPACGAGIAAMESA